MSIEARIQEALAAEEGRRLKPTSLIELETFYLEMMRLGLIRRSEYSIPPLDTVGRTGFEDVTRASALFKGQD